MAHISAEDFYELLSQQGREIRTMRLAYEHVASDAVPLITDEWPEVLYEDILDAEVIG